MKSKILILFSLMFLLSACSHAPAGFAPSVSPMEKSDYNILKHSSGSSSYLQLFYIFPTGRPDYDAAIKDAVGNVENGRTLINARAWTTSKFVFIGFKHQLNVEGDVIE